MNFDVEQLTQQAALLALKSMLEPDIERHKALAAECSDTMIKVVRLHSGARLAAARAMLDEAEHALCEAEAMSDPPERRKKLAVFEIYLQSARR